MIRLPSAWLYTFVWALSLAGQLYGKPALGHVAGMLLAVFLVLELPRQRRYAQVFFVAMALLGTAGLLTTLHPMSLLLAALSRSAVYAAFFFALATLRRAAEHSALIRRCGEHLVAQPPGRRYLALTAGGHVFGIILSYGAIELLGAMVVRANTLQAAGGNSEVRALRARRMLMAVYRGFATMNCWSPLNLMTAVVSTAVPGATLAPLLPLAFAVSVGMGAIGWALDRLHTPTGRVATAPATSEKWSIHLRVIALVALVMGLSEAAVREFGIGLVTAVTLVVPAVALAWVAIQCRGRGWRVAARLFARRLRRFLAGVPDFRGEANVLGLSGFVGVALGAALAGGKTITVLTLLPPIVIPLGVPVLLMAAGQVGLNPVATVALIGAVLPDPAAFGVAPAVLAFACMLGWGIGVSVTAMSASAITTARWLGVSPFVVSTKWNARFTLGCLLLAWAAIAGLHYSSAAVLGWSLP